MRQADSVKSSSFSWPLRPTKRWRKTVASASEVKGHIVKDGASRVEPAEQKLSEIHCRRSPWRRGEVEGRTRRLEGGRAKPRRGCWANARIVI